MSKLDELKEIKSDIAFFVLFSFFVFGVIVNYFELNSIKKQLDNIDKENHG